MPRSLHQKIVRLIPRINNNPERNLNQFINKGKECAAFGGINWKDVCWNITSSQIKDRGHKQREYNLWFTQHGSKIPRKIGEPLFKPFIEFAKALIRLRHQYGNQTCGNHMIVINSMRYLHAELAQQNYNPVFLNTDHFIRAEKSAQNELSIRSARQIGVYLVDIARTLNDNQLTKTKIYFQTSLPTSEAIDRLSDTAKKRRTKLLPRNEVLHALAEISKKLKNNADCIRMNIIKILLFTGFRIGEALTLPVDTLVIEPQTSSAGELVTEKIGLRYWPEKGAEPRIKWLPTEASKLVKDAINELIELTNDAREAAQWLEKNPTKLNTAISPETILDMSQVAEFVGVKNGVFYCKVRKIPIVEAPKSCGGYKKWYVKFKDLERSMLSQRWTKPMLRLSNGQNQKLSESLCVVFFEQLREYHPAIKWLVRPVSETNISNFICGANKVKNVFERYGFLDIKGNPLQIRSHSFRHLLNTLANEGGLTDVELAWWFGRKSIRDNESYDHRTAEQLTEKSRRMMLTGEIVGSIANAARQLEPLDASEFLKTHVNAVHHTPYGLCTHDFAQNPCEKHLNCLSNCKEYHRTIGNQEERHNLKLLQKQTSTALDHAKNEMKEGTWGANAWINHHQNILDNIRKSLALDEHLVEKTLGDSK